MKTFIIAIFVSLFIHNSAFAAVYKWTDSNGKIHFSDKPQRGSAEIKVNTRKPSAAKNTSNTQLKRQKELLLQYQNERDAKKKQQRKNKVANKKIANHCQRLKNRIMNYEEVDYLFIRQDDGSKNHLSDAEVDNVIKTLKNEFSEKCS